MALGGVSVSWNTVVPSDTSLGNTGASDVRSLKTTMNQVLDSEHVFSATGGSNVGVHRKGSAVAFYGASSALSSTDTDGRLMVDSTNSRLWHVGSSATYVLGGRYAIHGSPSGVADTGTNYGVAGHQHWAMEAGVFTFARNSIGTTITLRSTWSYFSALITPVTGSGETIRSYPSQFGAAYYNTNTLTVYMLDLTSGNISPSNETMLVNYLVCGTKAL